MPAASFLKYWAPGLLALGALLSNCEFASRGPTSPRALPHGAQDVRQQLQGTWLREHATKGVQVRRLLTLEPGGSFRETVRLMDPARAPTEHIHEGTWLYDGTNLKRKYTLMDGKPPSRLNLPFATFEVLFEGRNEFLGVDHIHGHKVRYRRVAPDTEL